MYRQGCSIRRMAEYKSWFWQPGTGVIDAEAVRRSKSLLRLAMACQAVALLGLAVATTLGATFPLPIWVLLLAGAMLLLGSAQRPVRPRASDLLFLTGFLLSVAAATLIFTSL